jgi:hypothetical protein
VQSRIAKSKGKNRKKESKLIVHFVLLTNAAATSQQLQITPNNFCLFASDQGCLRLLTVLSTACSASARRRSAAVVGAEKKKKKWSLN